MSQFNGTVMLNARIDRSIHKALKIKAAQTGKTMREIIEESLTDFCAEHKCARKGTELAVEPEA